MRSFISFAVALVLAGSVVPAMASDEASYWAFRKLSPMARAALTPLADDQLASIAGAAGLSVGGLTSLTHGQLTSTAGAASISEGTVSISAGNLTLQTDGQLASIAGGTGLSVGEELDVKVEARNGKTIAVCIHDTCFIAFKGGLGNVIQRNVSAIVQQRGGR